MFALLATAFVAGGVRGFAGFGAGLIFMPVAAALIDPRMAVVVFLTVDEFVAMPLAWRAVRISDWSTLLPAVIAASVTAPIGAWVLANGDILALRWAISLLALGLLVLLASGWRYRERPRLPVTLGVGAASGFLGGFAQISGPPIVAYWMSGPAPAAIIRANLIVYFLILSFGQFRRLRIQRLFFMGGDGRCHSRWRRPMPSRSGSAPGDLPERASGATVRLPIC